MIRSLHAGSRQSGGFSLNVFTDDELEDIHLSTLEVLQKTGVFVGDDEAMDVMDDEMDEGEFASILDDAQDNTTMSDYY